MIRMDHLLSVGGYDERFCGAEDYELWLRLANRYKVANLPQVLITKLVTPHQITARQFRNMPGLRVKLRYFDPTSSMCGLASSGRYWRLQRRGQSFSPSAGGCTEWRGVDP